MAWRELTTLRRGKEEDPLGHSFPKLQSLFITSEVFVKLPTPLAQLCT